MQQVDIRVKGRMDEHWSDWFEDLAITHTAEDETVLVGRAADQSALYGLLSKLEASGVLLLSVQ